MPSHMRPSQSFAKPLLIFGIVISICLLLLATSAALFYFRKLRRMNAAGGTEKNADGFISLQEEI